MDSKIKTIYIRVLGHKYMPRGKMEGKNLIFCLIGNYPAGVYDYALTLEPIKK